MSLELKKGDRVLVVVDHSGSMADTDLACDGDVKYRWMEETLLGYVDAAERFAIDGISMIFFNSVADVCGHIRTRDEAKALFGAHWPRGRTATHLAVAEAYRQHRGAGPGSSFVLIFTDGQADDVPALKQTIIDITHQMTTPEEFRIGFMSVGTIDDRLQAMFDELDEGLDNARFDIVGVLRPEDAGFEDAIAAIIDSSATNSEADRGYQGKGTTV